MTRASRRFQGIRLWSMVLVLWAGVAFSAEQERVMQLAVQPSLSPDGERVAFAWNGDIWQAATGGGPAIRLTTAPVPESQPRYSPDGRELAFIRERDGARQLHILQLESGGVRQLTYHSEGCELLDWFPDGKQLLVSGTRDHFWRSATRFFAVQADKRGPERELFNDYGADGRVSPDGKQLLFTREGERWWRKGYRGSRASQIWSWSFGAGKFQREVLYESESRSPLWKPDGKSYYYVSAQGGCWNLWERTQATGDERQLTRFSGDGVVEPTVSRDGKTLVFRVLGDLYRWRIGRDDSPEKLVFTPQGDWTHEPHLRRKLSEATEVAFSQDGLEIAMIVGGDVWVMDTELREPKQVTNTPEEERSPAFAPDGGKLLYVSDVGGQSDLWEATRDDAKQFWWRNVRFTLRRLTEDAEYEKGLRFSPTGELVAFQRTRGDLWVIRPDGKEARQVIASWNELDFDWSPDGKWFVYAQSDPEFNRDIFLLPLDGSRPPFNLSRHPDNDSQPKWSPDGKMIAFVGRRLGEETDIYYVHLRRQDEDRDRRDRTLEKALEKIQKARKGKEDGRVGGKGPTKSATAQEAQPSSSREESKSTGEDQKATRAEDAGGKKTPPEVTIDFDDLPRRLHRVAIERVDEGDLLWSHDSSKLAFSAEIAGVRGTHTVSFPDELKPKLLTNKTGSNARWIAEGNQILWLSDGKPGTVSATGGTTDYGFTVNQMIEISNWHHAVFDQCWRVMRDHWYDGTWNNLNWDEIRRKYGPLASGVPDQETLLTVIHMMLGELNGSHLGVSSVRGDSKPNDEPVREQTVHFGLRFEPSHRGPGLLVRDVIPESPATKVGGRIEPRETILAIDGVAVDPGLDLTSVLNGPLDRDFVLRVRNAAGQERDVTLRPITFATARGLLYEKWVRDNQAAVERLSTGKLGYLHIRGMDLPSFHRFEEELFAVASGKDGIVIDVRDNGGGFTTDHLLTVLTQPDHAITVPRGGQRGYPQDRRVYATWRKPIVVLCNQNSFSNAEIFSHAIKTLERGKLVGVTTAGGVISTGATRIMQAFLLRLPHRGWYLPDTGFDMERNGAVPHFTIWPKPGEMPNGVDRQLEKGVEVLQADVREWLAQPQPELRNASQRP